MMVTGMGNSVVDPLTSDSITALKSFSISKSKVLLPTRHSR